MKKKYANIDLYTNFRMYTLQIYTKNLCYKIIRQIYKVIHYKFMQMSKCGQEVKMVKTCSVSSCKSGYKQKKERYKNTPNFELPGIQTIFKGKVDTLRKRPTFNAYIQNILKKSIYLQQGSRTILTWDLSSVPIFDSNNEAINAANSVNIQENIYYQKVNCTRANKNISKMFKCFADIFQKLSLQSFTKYVETNL